MKMIIMFIAGLIIGILLMKSKPSEVEKQMQKAEIIRLKAEIEKLKENK